MEVFAILSSCVALIAITLIFNLFVNLRSTDKAVQNQANDQEIEKPKKKDLSANQKTESKTKKIKNEKKRPNDFKHKTLFTNLKGMFSILRLNLKLMVVFPIQLTYDLDIRITDHSGS